MPAIIEAFISSGDFAISRFSRRFQNAFDTGPLNAGDRRRRRDYTGQCGESTRSFFLE
jgi:hypothetical protein